MLATRSGKQWQDDSQDRSKRQRRNEVEIWLTCWPRSHSCVSGVWSDGG